MAGLVQFWRELRRRNVVKVAIAYVALAWLLLEVSSTVLPIIEAPGWILKNLLNFLVAGFPVALIFAWAYELTNEGVKRTSVVRDDQSAASPGNRFNVFVIIALLAALTYFIVDKIIEPPDAFDGTSIAVLPFDNRSAIDEDVFFVDGIHDDLLTQIAHISSLQVISRTSVLEYRGTTKNIKTIGKELGVDAILEGGVQRSGDQVRINMQLIDVATDKHLWAETYDRKLTAANIFAIQSEIASIVANAMHATLSAREQQRLAVVPTQSLEAYEAYLLGKHEFAKRQIESFEIAIPYFQRAIDLDPGFALAYVGLANAATLLYRWTGQERTEVKEKADWALGKALELDDQLGEAYALMGMRIEHDDPESALKYHERAVVLAPNYADGRNWYSSTLANLGRIDEAIPQLEIAVRLDPLNWPANANLAHTYADQGRTDVALAHLEKIVESNANLWWTYLELGTVYYNWLGRLDEAVIAFSKMYLVDSDNPYLPNGLAMLYLGLGDDESAEYWIQRAVSSYPDFEGTIESRIALYFYRGEVDKAGELAQDSINSDPDHVALILLRALRDHASQTGRYDAVRKLFEADAAELFNDPKPQIDSGNIHIAIDLVPVLRNTGDTERADMLLELWLEYLQHGNRIGRFGYGFADARIYALQGKTEAALNALRVAVDAHWRENWWYYARLDPALDSIRDEPEFQAMMDEIRRDMADQLASLRERESEAITLSLD